MLKVKEGIPLDELEKYGFEKEYIFFRSFKNIPREIFT